MSLLIELPPEWERVLEKEAAAHGQKSGDYAAEILRRTLPAPDENGHEKRPLTPRQQAVMRLYGSLKGNGRTVDDFLRERREEAEREMRAAGQWPPQKPSESP